MSITILSSLIAQQGALLPNQNAKLPVNLVTEISGEPNSIHLIDPAKLLKRLAEMSPKNNHEDAGTQLLLQTLLAPKALRMACVDDITKLNGMAERFPHLRSFLELLAGDIRLQVINKLPLHFKPTLLLGAPGLGKSWFTRQLSEELNLPYFEFQLSGSGDTLQLLGSARQWGRSAPGDLLRRMADSPIANPLIAFDEVDKAGGMHGSSVADVLLMFTEPENAKRFEDKYVGLPARMDLPSYFLTGNNADYLPRPLIDRCRVQMFTLPTNNPDWVALVSRMYREMLKLGTGLSQWLVNELSDEEYLAFCYGCSSVREVRQRLEFGIQNALQHIPLEQIEHPPNHKLHPIIPERKSISIGFGFTSTL